MPDAYDSMVDFLMENPSEILSAWANPLEHKAGGLFRYASANQFGPCGCLTQIRGEEDWKAFTPELTQAIKADKRIPRHRYEITPATLPVFAEWQRRIDKELNRTPPEWRE
jgi:hypothetical protein